MTESEKVERYERAYHSGKVCKNLWQYIPQKVRSGVTNAFADSDGYWIWLDCEKGNWTAYDHTPDCGIIHEYTITDIKKAVRTIDNLGVR